MKNLIFYIVKIPAILILASIAACFLPLQFMAVSLTAIILILIGFIITLFAAHLNTIDFDKIRHLKINGTVYDIWCVFRNADKNSELYQKLKIRMSLLQFDEKTLSLIDLDEIDIIYELSQLKIKRLENKSKNKLIKAYNNLFTSEELNKNNWTLHQLSKEIEKRLLEREIL